MAVKRTFFFINVSLNLENRLVLEFPKLKNAFWNRGNLEGAIIIYVVLLYKVIINNDHIKKNK